MNNNNSSEDFWDLDDDDLDLDPPAPAEEPASEPVQEDSPESAEQAPPEPAAAPSPQAERPAEIRVKGKSSAKRALGKMSLIEKISVLAVFLFLGGVAAWGLSNYYKHAPQGELITFDTDFPVKGETVTVSELDTWWRPPVREGDNADRGVRLTFNLIPCARIKVEDTQNAHLWVTFRNGDKDLIGDPINLIISNGKFLGSGTDEIEIHSTSGFSNASEINAYTNEDIAPWSVVIVEGNEGQDFTSDSEPFCKVRIEAKVPDEKEVD